MKRLFLFAIMFILSSKVGTLAQNRKIDSLLNLIKSDKEDTNKVIHLYTVCKEYHSTGQYDKGLNFGKKALTLAQNLGFKKGIANSYNHIGLIYWKQGNYPEALKNYFAALKIREEIKDNQGIASSYNNIGIIYEAQSNYPEALNSYSAALKIFEQIGNKKGIGSSYNNIGAIYQMQGKYPEAIKNHFAALKIRQEIKNKKGIAGSYVNIGGIYYEQNDYPDALKMYFISLKIMQEIEDKDGIAQCFLNLGHTYTRLNKTNEAQDYLNRALKLSKEIGSNDVIKETYAGLWVLDSAKGNYKNAFEHHKLFIIYRDSLNNEETKKKSLQSAMQYEFEKKEIAAKAEQDKLNALAKEEKQKQQIIIYVVAGVLLLVVVFSTFLFNRFRITNRQKIIIEKQKEQVDKAYESLQEKNKEVMDSIHYAKRIQRSLLPTEKNIVKNLNKLIK